jgi:hypothetical protein
MDLDRALSEVRKLKSEAARLRDHAARSSGAAAPAAAAGPVTRATPSAAPPTAAHRLRRRRVPLARPLWRPQPSRRCRRGTHRPGRQRPLRHCRPSCSDRVGRACSVHRRHRARRRGARAHCSARARRCTCARRGGIVRRGSRRGPGGRRVGVGRRARAAVRRDPRRAPITAFRDGELQSAKLRLSKLYFREVEESRRRAQRLQLLLEDICAIGAALDLDTVLARLAETLCKRMGFRIVVVRVREPRTDRLTARAFAGVDDATRAALESEEVRLGSLMSQLSEESKVSRSYFIGGGDDHPGPSAAASESGGPEWRPEQVLLVPIYGRTGELVACFSVEDPEDGLVPSIETVGLLEILGNLAGASIENAALYGQLEGHARDVELFGRRTQELHSLKNDFISTVSRELRTPLAAIRAHVETLLAAREEEIPFDLQRRFLAILHDESERLARLVESMLDLNRFDAGVLRIARENVDLAGVLEEAAGALAPAAEAAQVDLKAEIDAADTRMDADRDQIKQLVLHLGGNAVKFTPRGGRVTLRLSGDARDVTLQVEDSGSGIPRRCSSGSSGAPIRWTLRWSAATGAPAWGSRSAGRSWSGTAGACSPRARRAGVRVSRWSCRAAPGRGCCCAPAWKSGAEPETS